MPRMLKLFLVAAGSFFHIYSTTQTDAYGFGVFHLVECFLHAPSLCSVSKLIFSFAPGLQTPHLLPCTVNKSPAHRPKSLRGHGT